MSEQNQTDAMSSSASDYRMPQLHFTMIESRRFFADLPYLLPCDTQESMNQHIFHQLLTAMHPEQSITKISPQAQILDVGCGAGEWLHDLKKQYPTINGMGVDVLPPVHSTQAMMPVNILAEQLPFPDQRFDLVHMRAMMTAIPNDRIPFVISELIRVTRIGGRIELIDEAPLQMPTSAYRTFSEWMRVLSVRRNLTPGSGHLLDQYLDRRADIASLQRQKFMLSLVSPELSNSSTLGVMGSRYIFNTMRSLKPALTANAIASANAIDMVLSNAYKEWVAAQFPPQFTVFAVAGQRVA